MILILSYCYDSNNFTGNINYNVIGKNINNHTIYDLDKSKNHKISELLIQNNNKPIILHYTASWCNFCKKNLKSLLYIKDKYNINIYNILWKDNTKNYTHSASNTFFFKEKTSLSNDLKIYAVPTTVIVSEKGEVIMSITGTINDYIIEKYIKTLIKK